MSVHCLQKRATRRRSGGLPAGRTAAALLLAAALLAPSLCPGQERFLARSLGARILVHDPEVTVARLVGWTEEQGGYFVYRSLGRVLLRVPDDSAESFRSLLVEQADEVVEISLEARDLRQRLLQVRAGIESRQEILQRNLAHLRGADVAGTLAIEREIQRLMGEIESLKGELRRLEQDRRYMVAEVLLSFQDQTLPRDIPSSFQWINQVDFYRYMEGGIGR
ncbi:MAG: DUF4349 domain-containing protein [Spirochaetota bacterium]